MPINKQVLNTLLLYHNNVAGFHIEKKGIRIFGVSESFAGFDLQISLGRCGYATRFHH